MTFFSTQLRQYMYPTAEDDADPIPVRYTTEEFADLMNSFGPRDFNSGRVKNLLADRVTPTFDVLLRISVATGIPLIDLIADSGRPFRPYDLYNGGRRAYAKMTIAGKSRLEVLEQYKTMAENAATELRFFQVARMVIKATERRSTPQWVKDAARDWKPVQRHLNAITDYWGTLYTLEATKPPKEVSEQTFSAEAQEARQMTATLRDLGKFAIIQQGATLIEETKSMAILLGNPNDWRSRFGEDTARVLGSILIPALQRTNTDVIKTLAKEFADPTDPLSLARVSAALSAYAKPEPPSRPDQSRTE